MKKEEMSKADQKILYDWIYRRCKERFTTAEILERKTDKYFNDMFEYGGAEEFLEMAKKDEPYEAYLFMYIEE